jgi:hypothetical protein
MRTIWRWSFCMELGRMKGYVVNDKIPLHRPNGMEKGSIGQVALEIAQRRRYMVSFQ